MKYLLDLDDVLVDTTNTTYKFYGVTPRIGEWSEVIGKPDTEILKDIDTFTFWLSLPKMPWADELIDYISSLTDNWGFLSCPTENPDSWSGKAAWVKLHYPQHIDRLLLLRKKRLAASHQHCLIDDRKQNIVSFQNAGGMAIPFPSQNGHFFWDREQLEDPVRYVKKHIEKVETVRLQKI